ncbi:MAG: hypothetical protein ACOX7B_15525 [Christensenellales bacterium]
MQAAAWYQGKVHVLIYLTNTEHAWEAYSADGRNRMQLATVTALPKANYISGLMVAGAHLLAVHEVWDETAQWQSKLLGRIIADATQQLPFTGQAWSVFLHENGDILTLEKDAPSRWLLRGYAW